MSFILWLMTAVNGDNAVLNLNGKKSAEISAQKNHE